MNIYQLIIAKIKYLFNHPKDNSLNIQVGKHLKDPMKIKSGNNSINIQCGGSLHINKKENK